jgi:Family of unknown function (DUF6502)
MPQPLPTSDSVSSVPSEAGEPDGKAAALEALAALLVPLARLAVNEGLTHGQIDECLRRALVAEVAALHPEVPAHRSVSRISAATGLNRREVTRLAQGRGGRAVGARSWASDLFARWMTDPRYRGEDGQPRALPRLGNEGSFESLAATVTRDVHFRSLMDELLRLGLARYDVESDTLALCREGFVPAADRSRMLGFLADNAGDHLHAAVDNVLGGGRRHFEQAVFADGLSADSMVEVRRLVAPQWKALLDALVPALQQRVDADAKRPPAEAAYRVRIGLYAFDDAPREKSSTPEGRTSQPRRLPRTRRDSADGC